MQSQYCTKFKLSSGKVRCIRADATYLTRHSKCSQVMKLWGDNNASSIMTILCILLFSCNFLHFVDDRVSEKISNCPKVTQLVSGRVWIQTYICSESQDCFSPRYTNAQYNTALGITGSMASFALDDIILPKAQEYVGGGHLFCLKDRDNPRALRKKSCWLWPSLWATVIIHFGCSTSTHPHHP